MAITIKLGALITDSKFVNADLTSITIDLGAGDGDVGIGTLGATVINDTTISIPGYGTITKATATGLAATFTAAAAFPTGAVTLTDGTLAGGAGPVLFTAADFSATTAAITFVGGENLTIVGGSGNDTLTAGAKTTTITSGAGNDTVTSGAATTAINTGDGNDTITHNQTTNATIITGSGNDTVGLAGATGNNVIQLGDGDDSISLDATSVATISGGAGADTFTAATNGATMVVTDYNYAEGDKVVFTAAATPTLDKTTGKLSDTNVSVQVKPIDDVYKVKVTNNGAAQEYWTAAMGAANVTMNGATVAAAMTINASGATNAVIQGGYANDSITLGTAQATITASKTSGTDTVVNFTDGFAGDVINLSGATVADLTFGNVGQVSISGGTAVVDTDATWTDEGAVLVQENGGTAKKVAFGMLGGTNTITKVDADVYIGTANKATILDLTASTVDGATINLSDAKYQNIYKVTSSSLGGTYIGTTDTVTGNTFNLAAAKKASQVWGNGKGNDTVAFGANTVQDVMWFGTADGADSVTGFVSGFGDTKDVVNLYDVADATAIDIKLGGAATHAVITTSTGNAVSLDGVVAGADKATQLQLKDKSGIVKKLAFGVDTKATINGTGADMVIGKAETATTLNVVKYTESTSALTVNLLDTTKFKNVHDVDLSTATAAAGTTNIVVGAADTIGSTLKVLNVAGTTTDVWGGSKANDTIAAGAGTDTVWFGTGDGADSVTAFAAGTDKVKFYDKALSEITTGYTYAAGKFTSQTVATDSLELNGIAGATLDILDKNNTATKAVVGAAGLVYNKDAKIYMSAAGNSGLTFTAPVIEDVVLYLGNGKDAAFNDTYFAGIKDIDANNVLGNTTLIGEKSVGNILKGGKVSSAMWGGGMSSDEMHGQNSAIDQFWFGTGDGIDSAKAGVDKADTVVLYNVASIKDVTMTVGTGVETISLKDGSILTITDTTNTALTGGLTFQVGTGSTAKSYTYDTTAKDFVAK